MSAVDNRKPGVVVNVASAAGTGVIGLLADVKNVEATLSEWAEVASMSERSLRRQIERETGMTFGRWRQQFQLAIALSELRSGVPIKIVADKLGYESIAAFSTMFTSSAIAVSAAGPWKVIV